MGAPFNKEPQMLCIKCSKREVKYFKRNLCNSCYVVAYRQGKIIKDPPTEKCSYCGATPDVTRAFVKGLCWACYYRNKKKGKLEYDDKTPKPCLMEGCQKVATAHGLCDTHRKRMERTGDIDTGRPSSWGKDPAKARKHYTLAALFGISIIDYNKMLEDQGGLCKICKKAETTTAWGKIRSLSVDHCHSTKKVRGLLCSACNAGIGYLCDSTYILRSAIDYLEQSRQE